MRRTLALWLLLAAVYVATLGLDAFAGSDFGGDEPHFLLAVESLAHDGNVDVRDEYLEGAYRDFYPRQLERRGHETDGALNEPLGLGLPLLVLPAYLIGGPTGVELLLAALAALAAALAYRLALRVVPDPWAGAAALGTGLSAPFLAYSTAVLPALPAGTALAGATLLALRLDERPTWRPAFGCFALLGTLPWLGAQFVPAGVVVGAFAARAIWRARKRTLAIGSVEVSLFSVAFYVGINEALYGGPMPSSAEAEGEGGFGASSTGAYLERVPRLVTLLADPAYGLLRWAPLFALTFAGLWWLWRAHRDRLAHAVPGLHDVEVTAGLCAAALGVQFFVAAFLAPEAYGDWFPGRYLIAGLPLAVPLIGWGLRRAPRLGTLLVAATVVISLVLYADLRFGDGAWPHAVGD